MRQITKLIIQGELTDLNTYIDGERRNRHIGAKIKKANTDLCLWQIKGKTEPIEAKCKIVFTWYTPNEKKDPDNVAFAKKYILDAIVKAGILKNDGRKQIAEFQDKFEVGTPRVEIELCEVV